MNFEDIGEESSLFRPADKSSFLEVSDDVLSSTRSFCRIETGKVKKLPGGQEGQVVIEKTERRRQIPFQEQVSVELPPHDTVPPDGKIVKVQQKFLMSPGATVCTTPYTVHGDYFLFVRTWIFSLSDVDQESIDFFYRLNKEAIQRINIVQSLDKDNQTPIIGRTVVQQEMPTYTEIGSNNCLEVCATNLLTCACRYILLGWIGILAPVVSLQRTVPK